MPEGNKTRSTETPTPRSLDCALPPALCERPTHSFANVGCVNGSGSSPVLGRGRRSRLEMEERIGVKSCTVCSGNSVDNFVLASVELSSMYSISHKSTCSANRKE